MFLKNDFSSNLLAIIPVPTADLVFVVMSSNWKSFTLLNPGYSGWRLLKMTSERSLRL